MSRQSRPLIYWGMAFLILAAAVAALKPGAVWITDNGNKYIIMRNLAQGNGLNISHSCPELFPTGGFHFIKTGHGISSFYPEFLSFFTVPFYKVFGEKGVLFFPLASTLLLLFIAWRYWHIPAFLLLSGTPLLFYSLLLWEMTPSVFLVTGTLILILKKRPFIAGTVLGASLLMREEAYFVCAALGAALLLCGQWKEAFKLGGGFLIPASLIWLYQWGIHGHFLGKHGKYYYLNNNEAFSISNQYKVILFNYFHHLLRFDGWGGSPLKFLVFSIFPVLAAGCAPGFRKWRIFKYISGTLHLVAMLILAVGAWFQQETIYASSMLTGFLTATPVMLGFFLNWRSFLICRKFRIITLFIILYIVCVPPLLTASDVGLVWGARHFLVLMPLMLYLSLRGFHLMGSPAINGGLLPVTAAAAGIAIQLYGVWALYHVSGECRSMEQKILSRPEKVIVTDIFYLPEQMPRLFFEKTVLQLITHGDLKKFEHFLRKTENKKFLLLLSPDPRFRRMPDDVLKKLLTRFPLTAHPERLEAKGKFPDFFIAVPGSPGKTP